MGLALHACLCATSKAVGGLILHCCELVPLSRSYDNLCPAEDPALHVLLNSNLSIHHFWWILWDFLLFSFLKCQVDLLQQLLRRSRGLKDHFILFKVSSETIGVNRHILKDVNLISFLSPLLLFFFFFASKISLYWMYSLLWVKWLQEGKFCYPFSSLQKANTKYHSWLQY